MKKYLLIVLPLLFIVGCSKTEPIDESMLIDNDGIMFLPDHKKPYTGEVFSNYDTGEKLYHGKYNKGELISYQYLNKDGTEKTFSDSLIELLKKYENFNIKYFLQKDGSTLVEKKFVLEMHYIWPDEINDAITIIEKRLTQFQGLGFIISKKSNNNILVNILSNGNLFDDNQRILQYRSLRFLLQSSGLFEIFILKSTQSTNDMVSAIDEILNNQTEDAQNRFLGESQSESDPFFGVNNIDDYQFSNLLTALPGDMGIEEKNVYAFKKLLENEKIQAKLKNSNGQFLFSHESQSITPDETEKYYRLYFLYHVPELTGGIIDEARADLRSLGGGSTGQPVVSLKMNNEGSKSWSRVTGANVGERIAIVLDKKVYMAPLIREKITDGRTQIEGFANINEAEDFANILTSGNYPSPVHIVEEHLVSTLVEKIVETTNNESISNNVGSKDNSSMWIGTFSGLCPEYNMKNKYGEDLIINGNRVPVPSTHYTFEIYDNNTCSIYMKDNNGKEYSCHNINYSVSSNSNSFSLSMKPETGSACGGNEIILFKRGSQFKIASGKSGFPEFIINKIK